jgi:hypothetical protein
MSTYDEVAAPENLARAWRWLKSNPDASYKKYCRETYGIFAIAEEALLEDLADRLNRRLYEPSKACKLFFPKPSGILRPYSLLSVEDQVVYQAAVNVIAERLLPRVKHRYMSEVFGHLYAGRSGTWFYRRWSDGYAKFNDAARKAVAKGFRVAASFDLTACYDSLDHGVLRTSLKEIGCDKEFGDLLSEWLSTWTATNDGMFLSHGIPQGPLGSGLLSEVILRHFDERRRAEQKVLYFRYVDDIRLFGRSEHDLRSMLIKLDLLSKDIGLFPQSSKIEIHEVKDIEAELKTISSPTEGERLFRPLDQNRLRKKLNAVTPRFNVSNPTRFKHLLAQADPSAELTNRLWRIFERHPEYYGPVTRYLMRYPKLPRLVAERLVAEIKKQKLYPAITASLLEVAEDRLDATHCKEVDRIVKGIWKPRTLQCELFAVAGRWAIRRGLLTAAQTRFACEGVTPWWARAQLLAALNPAHLGTTPISERLNAVLRSDFSDVAMTAAFEAARQGVQIDKPFRSISHSGSILLKELGLLRRRRRICGIDTSLKKLLGSIGTVNWRQFFGPDYRRAERQIVVCRGLVETNISAWVNAIDVFNDWLLISLYRRESALGTYHAGSIGSIKSSTRLGEGLTRLV